MAPAQPEAPAQPGAEPQPLQAEGADLWAIPPAAIAWFAMDPSLFGSGEATDPARVAIESGLRALALDLPGFEPASASAPARVLDWLQGQDAPYRIAMMKVEAKAAGARTRAGPSPLRLERLAAVADLRDGTELRAFSNADLGPVLAVRALEGRALISASVGAEGVLDQWIAAEGVRRDQADPWDGHRARASAAAGVPQGLNRGSPVLEAYVDLNALRRGMPDALDGTRLHRVLREWGLINARSIMFHVHVARAEQVRSGEQAYRGAPLLAIELTWSLRSEPRDVIHAASLARAEWPADAASNGLSPQPGTYALLARAEWGRWLQAVLSTYRVSGSSFEELTRSTRLDSWRKSHSRPAERLMQASSGWVLAWAPGVDEGESASGLMLLAPIKEGVDASGVRRDLDQVSGSIGPDVRFDPKREWWEATLDRLAVKWMYAGGGQERALLMEIEVEKQ